MILLENLVGKKLIVHDEEKTSLFCSYNLGTRIYRLKEAYMMKDGCKVGISIDENYYVNGDRIATIIFLVFINKLHNIIIIKWI